MSSTASSSTTSTTSSTTRTNNHNEKCCDPPMKCKLFPYPTIHRGIRWAKIHVKKHGVMDGSIATERVWLIRSDTNAQVAYRKLLTKPPIHSPSNTCLIVYCVVLTRVVQTQKQGSTTTNSSAVFEEPPPPPEDDDDDNNDYNDDREDDMYRHLVCVKKYTKRKIPNTTTSDYHVKDGYVVQTLGGTYNERHAIITLQAIDILEDDQYVYIVCPYSKFGSLEENIFLYTPSSLLGGTQNVIRHREQKIKIIFRHLFKVIHKLHDHHRICHFNLCPSTILLNEDDTLPSVSSSSSSSSFNSCKLFLEDFALSLMYPTSTTTAATATSTTRKQRRHWILLPQEGIILQTQKEYLSPELYQRKNKFDGPSVDIWVAGVLLFNLLTGHKLYNFPSSIDPIYTHIIVNGGLINKDNINERTLDTLLNNNNSNSNKDINHHSKNRHNNPSSSSLTERLVEIILALNSLSFGAKSLLQGMLQMNPNERFSAEDVLHHPWMTIR